MTQLVSILGMVVLAINLCATAVGAQPAARGLRAAVAGGANTPEAGGGPCLEPHPTPGCDDPFIENCVCSQDPFCCDFEWDQTCVNEVFAFGCVSDVPLNDDCAAALSVVADGTYLFRNNAATLDGPPLPIECDEMNGNGLDIDFDIWFCYTPDCSNDVAISLCGESNFDSRMAIYRGCACPVTNDRLEDCNDDSESCIVAQRPEITFAAVGGTSYLIRVGGGEGEGTLEIDGGSAHNHLDCDANGVLDGCEILTNDSEDCNGNQYPDVCEIADHEVLAHQIPNQAQGLFADADCAVALCPNGAQTRAERFQISAWKRIEAIGLWGGYFPDDLPPASDDFTVIIHTDKAGLPGIALSTQLGVASVRALTGVQLFLVDEWYVTLTLNEPLWLAPGAYFVEVYNNTIGTTDSFFWELGDLDTDHGIAGSAWDVVTPGEIWTPDEGINMAMVLFAIPAADCDGDQTPDVCQAAVACCLPDDTCAELIATCCTAVGGEAQVAGTNCATFDCLIPEIVHEAGLPDQTRPHSGYIDPRAESTDGGNVDLGLREAFIRFNAEVVACNGADVGVGNFVLTETGGGQAPTVDDVQYVEADKTYVRVHWDRPVTVQQWTTLRASVCNENGSQIISAGDLGPGVNEPDRVDFGYLPADVDQNGTVGPFDLLRFRQYANGVSEPDAGLAADYIDTNRNGTHGQADPFDLLAFRQLTNGISPSTRVWLGESIVPRP